MNPIVPTPAEYAFSGVSLVNVILVIVALMIVLRAPKRPTLLRGEVLAIVLLPLVGPLAVLWLRWPRRPHAA